MVEAEAPESGLGDGLTASAMSSRVKIAIPRDTPFFVDPMPTRFNYPEPVGWRNAKVSRAQFLYEHTSSLERLTAASLFAPVSTRKAPQRDFVGSSSRLKSKFVEGERRRQEALRAEGARLAAMLTEPLPKARPGQHLMQRQVPAAHDHWTHRGQAHIRVHRNILMPLDAPHDFDKNGPLVPRAWKLPSSASAPQLSGRRARPPPATAPLAAPAPLGMSGLPSTVPARKIFQYGRRAPNAVKRQEELRAQRLSAA